MRSISKRFRISKNIPSHSFSKTRFPLLRYFLAGFLMIVFAPQTGAAQDGPPPASIIDDSNVSTFQGYLPPELADFVRNGSLKIQASGESAPPVRDFALPIGQYADEGERLLKQMEAVFSSQRFMSYDFVLKYIQSGKVVASAQGILSRYYPSAPGDMKPDGQLFREKIRLTNPRRLSPYSWLTFRFIGNSEDLVWLYSPFIKRERQLAPSVRDDALFYSSLSASDLFTFSGKQQLFDARIVEQKPYLVPIRVTDPSEADTAECYSTSVSDTQAGRYSYRDTLKAALVSRDPYSRVGFLMVYIDAESLLPVYSFAYSRDRALDHAVVSGYDIVPAPKRSVPFRFVYRSTAAYDAGGKTGSEITVTGGMICDQFPQGWALKNFDPSFLGDDHP